MISRVLTLTLGCSIHNDMYTKVSSSTSLDNTKRMKMIIEYVSLTHRGSNSILEKIETLLMKRTKSEEETAQYLQTGQIKQISTRYEVS